ncbi:protein daughter of sevenless-like, partial [Lethenteron reissneri]|uniref:protein daughter of sevenless-like n=1 Tax=Lethenteron reissneri TaxID=7753 RepID=UPI002AB6E4DF
MAMEDEEKGLENHERSGGTAADPPSSLGYVFGLRTPERAYVLEADSAHEMHAWVKALRQLCGQHDGTHPANQSKSPSPSYSANAGQSGGSSHPRSGAITRSTSAIFPVPARSHAPSPGSHAPSPGHTPSPGHAHSLDQLHGAEQRLHPHRLRSQSQPSSALGAPPRSQGGSEGEDVTYLTPRTMSMPTQQRVAPLSSSPSLGGGTTLGNM